MAATDFLLPAGALDASHFPGVALEDYLDAWETLAGTLATGAGLTGDEHAEAVTAYVYWRAYNLLAESFLATEASARTPDGTSYTISDRQIAYWSSEAARWRRAWEAATGANSGLASMSVPLRVGF